MGARLRRRSRGVGSGSFGAAISVVICVSLYAATGTAFANPYVQADTTRVTHYEAIEAAKLGIAPVPATVEEVGAGSGQDAQDDAWTLGFDAAGGDSGPETRCEIFFGPHSHGIALSAIDAATAHEVFHCLSGKLAPTVAAFDQLVISSKWLVEGSATWVASEFVANDHDYARSWWGEYLLSPTRPLFNRTYDAIGFFGHLAQSGISPWSVFRGMFAATTNAGAYQASGASNGSALDSEASSFFGDQSLGDPWTAWHQGDATADSNVPHLHLVAPTVTVADGDTRTLRVKPYAEGDYRLLATAPVMTVSVPAVGYARLHSTDGPFVDVAHISDLTLCKAGGGGSCRCPDGMTPPDAHSFKVGDLAITGGPFGASVTITGGCELPTRPCTDLDLTRDFPAPGPTGPDQVREHGVQAGLQGMREGTACSVQAPNSVPPPECNDSGNCQPLGFYDLLSFDTDEHAKKAFATVVKNVLFDGSTPVDVGDEAAISSAQAGGFSTGGVVRVQNDVFVFRWLPAFPADRMIGAKKVLIDAANLLCAGCSASH